MATPSDLEQQIAEKSDDALVEMLHQPEDWLPESLDVARSELTRRKVNFTSALSELAALDSADAIRKAAEPLADGEAVQIFLYTLFGLVPGIFYTHFKSSGYKRAGYEKKARQCQVVFGCSLAIWVVGGAALILFAFLSSQSTPPPQ